MPPTLTPQEFVHRWRNAQLKERSAAQSHFIDLCRLLGVPTPVEEDSTGDRYTFEAGARKQGGGDGWADVWKRHHFAWEYKGRHADLDKAYDQLLKYRESLENPPLLIVSDMAQIVVHTNFTNTVKRKVTFTLDDLLYPDKLALLRAAFTEPERYRSRQTTEEVTREAAIKFAQIAGLLRAYGEDNHEIARFLIRLLFCLFAEDINLLPNRIFSQLVRATRARPALFEQQLGELFAAMGVGGLYSLKDIPHIDGGLFDDASTLPVDTDILDILMALCDMDWSNIEPSILGTLFERSLDPDKRSQLGAHYTSREDILLIVEPVLMAPLRRRWAEARLRIAELAEAWRAAPTAGGAKTRALAALERAQTDMLAEIAAVKVLDPACGSGNFLYVALRQLLDLWKEVSAFGAEQGLSLRSPLPGTAPHPAQLYGIEINPYAHALAQATVWIGYLQWLRENGYGAPAEPILQHLDTIREMDAILAYDDEGRPVEPEWPAVDVIIGNPPFLGGGRIRSEMGKEYTEALFDLYGDRLPNFSDLACYWIEKARAMIDNGMASRAGLLATQGIRGGANRTVLERIKETGDIFWAQSDRDWVLDGAAVHISMIGFDDGTERHRTLNGMCVDRINTDLTSALDLTLAVPLFENRDIGYRGNQKGGAFDIDESTARHLLSLPCPAGRSNDSVLRRWVNGSDITGRARGMWLIDFGTDMDLQDAAEYEAPFEYIREHVYPARRNKPKWWIHERPRPAMRAALLPLSKYIVTPHVSKHRIYVWLSSDILPDHQLIVFARDDDYFFGVLHSRLHELWSRRQGTQLREATSGCRYTPTTCFETFPFPWPPGQEPGGVTPGEEGDARVRAIADAARELVAKREAWLNPEGAGASALKSRTLTNLYNQRPTWLALIHRRLDEAVLDAYGWPRELAEPGDDHDEEILRRLLALNKERAA